MPIFLKDDLAQYQTSDNILSSILSCYLQIVNSDNEPQTVLGCSKGLMSWSNKLLDFCKTYGSGSTSFFSVHQKASFEYIWFTLDQPVDSVKHNTKNLIKNIVQSLEVSISNWRLKDIDRVLTVLKLTLFLLFLHLNKYFRSRVIMKLLKN